VSAGEAWVTVERFVDPVSAQIARSRLEADGIECYLADEGMGGLYTYSLMRGVRLQVRPEDEERAREILGEPPEETGTPEE
jgi:hypothetical protein